MRSSEGPPSKEPITFDKLVAHCNKIVDATHGLLSIRGLGNPPDHGGDDLDGWLIFQDGTIPDDQDVQEEIRKAIAKVGDKTHIKTHLFFVSKSDFDAGRIIPANPNVPRIEEFLSLHEMGLPPLATEYCFKDNDASLLNLIIRSQMREISTSENKGFHIDQDHGLQEIKLSREGIVSYIHYYTACFLGTYLRGRDPQNEGEYAKRVAKFMTRIVLGNFLSQYSDNDFPALQDKLRQTIQSAGIAPTDKVIADFIFEENRTKQLLTNEEVALLETARDIRSGVDRPGLDLVKYSTEAERELIYAAFTPGIFVRQEVEGKPIESMHRRAIEAVLLNNPEELGINLEWREDGDKLAVEDKEDNGDLFYIPPTYPGKNNRPVPQTGSCKIFKTVSGIRKEVGTKSSGSFLGEVSALFGGARTADIVVVGQDVVSQWEEKKKNKGLYVLRINGAKFRNLIHDYHTKEALDQPIWGQKARLVDLLLRYFAYDPAYFLRSLNAYSELLAPEFPETHETICADPNPFAQYYLNDGFLEAMENLQARKFSYDQKTPMVEEVAQTSGKLFRKLDKVNGKFYVVVDGKVILSDISETPSDTVTLFKGAVFGEASLLGEKERNGTATLTEGTRVLAVDAAAFHRLVSERREKFTVNVARTNYTPIRKDITSAELLYHLAALSTGRVRQRVRPESQALRQIAMPELESELVAHINTLGLGLEHVKSREGSDWLSISERFLRSCRTVKEIYEQGGPLGEKYVFEPNDLFDHNWHHIYTDIDMVVKMLPGFLTKHPNYYLEDIEDLLYATLFHDIGWLRTQSDKNQYTWGGEKYFPHCRDGVDKIGDLIPFLAPNVVWPMERIEKIKRMANLTEFNFLDLKDIHLDDPVDHLGMVLRVSDTLSYFCDPDDIPLRVQNLYKEICAIANPNCVDTQNYLNQHKAEIMKGLYVTDEDELDRQFKQGLLTIGDLKFPGKSVVDFVASEYLNISRGDFDEWLNYLSQWRPDTAIIPEREYYYRNIAKIKAIQRLSNSATDGNSKKGIVNPLCFIESSSIHALHKIAVKFGLADKVKIDWRGEQLGVIGVVPKPFFRRLATGEIRSLLQAAEVREERRKVFAAIVEAFVYEHRIAKKAKGRDQIWMAVAPIAYQPIGQEALISEEEIFTVINEVNQKLSTLPEANNLPELGAVWTIRQDRDFKEYSEEEYLAYAGKII
ncbi:cyclic nucleotide-binding domain-containing protein, partial [Candidatus Microgenomates bacterium]|nr:cyclic nucleotide-binding domain-containing protein [Candidatus Microgenomates bacterium]